MLYLPTNFTKVCFNFSWLGWSTITLRKLYSWCKYQEVKGSKDQLLVLPELQSSSSTSILTFSSWRFFCEDSVVCSLLHHIVYLIIPNHMVMHYWHFRNWVIKICNANQVYEGDLFIRPQWFIRENWSASATGMSSTPP